MYVQSDYQEVLLYYYYTINQQVYQVDNGFTGAALNNAKQYDCLLVNHNADLPETFMPYHATNISRFVQVYLKNK
jgi:hypothetical protein